MHDEVRRLAESLKEIYGDKVIVAPSDDLPNLTDTEIVFLTMDCGNLEHAADAARAANQAVELAPDIRLLFGVSGCKDDPRELDQIPEAQLTLATFFANLSSTAFRRLDIEHRALIAVALGYGSRSGEELHNLPVWVMEGRK